MSNYLIAMSIGPVQSFIAAGRKSQDLWCGSWLLSEISRAAAYSLHKLQSGCLIFPCPDDPENELRPRSETDKPEANIASVIRAEIVATSPEQVQALITQAKQAVTERLRSLFSQIDSEDMGIDIVRWQQQQDEVVHIFSAWVPFEPQHYEQASKRLDKILHARKQTRDFVAMQDNAAGFHKSTLDGANNSLTNTIQKPYLKNRLGLTQGEQLDALGIVKRLAGRLDQFTPFSRIVAHTWLASLKEEQRQGLKDLKGHYKQFVEAGVATSVKGNGKCYQDFPYDGEYLYLSRLEQEVAVDDTIKAALVKQLQQLGSAPIAYGVLLKADGDRMGELFYKAKTPNDSRAISKQMHRFASDTRSLVREFGGHVIYTGGDDVLAFLPLADAVTCAQRLSECFQTLMQQATKSIDGEYVPTLSVGLAVGHFVQPVRQLRNRAVAAEQLAKGEHIADRDKRRNGLAISIGLRSGHDIQWRCNWHETDVLARLTLFTNSFSKGDLPSRITQDVRQMARDLDWTAKQDELKGIRLSEFERMLDRAEPANGKSTGKKKELKKELKQALQTAFAQCSLEELANQLYIAQWLSGKTIADNRM